MKILEGAPAALLARTVPLFDISHRLEQIQNKLGKDQNPLDRKSYNFTLNKIHGFTLIFDAGNRPA